MKRYLDTKKRPANWEFIERNLALRARAQMLCETARELRVRVERMRSENRRLRDASNKLVRQIEDLAYVATTDL